MPFAYNALLPFIISFLVSTLVTAGIVVFGKKLKIIDDPKLHLHTKITHKVAVPRGGGIPIIIALLTGAAFFLPLSNPRIWGILLGASVLAIVGFLDDRFSEKISPYFRLGINAIAALLVIGVGIGIPYITNPLGGILHLDQPQFCFLTLGASHCIWILADIFAFGWLLSLQNVVGWSSGVDGQLPGFVVIAAITIGIMSLKFADAGQLPVLILAAITAGAYLGFLPWNWYPQKIMPGYGGKSLAGFLLGVLAILSGAKVGALIIILGVPIIDAVLVIIKRLSEGRSPVWGGREHLHHSLLDKWKWGRRRIAIFYWITSATLALLALGLNSQSKYFTMAAAGLVIAGFILWLQRFSTFSKRPDPDNG